MALDSKSDFDDINSLINDDDISHIEFTESLPSDKNIKGGAETLDYLDDYSSAQYGSNNGQPATSSYEGELYDIFQKANDYRNMVNNSQNKMDGGKKTTSSAEMREEEEKEETEGTEEIKKPKKETVFTVMIKISGVLRKSGKFPGIRTADFMKISKMIYKDAKEKAKSDDIESIKKIALKIAEDDSEEYVEKFNEQKTSTKSNIRKMKSIKGGNLFNNKPTSLMEDIGRDTRDEITITDLYGGNNEELTEDAYRKFNNVNDFMKGLAEESDINTDINRRGPNKNYNFY
ncbi:MAG: hypothetical protein Satyrvirus2_41 [Satyrvirus sp.]|uniref:Uncharacterized protein n=1 Tax=Satyrvirus sp. TaxID=2487771 RepID=A0A3G5ACX9_9VIRU|nr:MAG: hypothetical protein Satyrvirus2_41 [Satyrvirus sp.]